MHSIHRPIAYIQGRRVCRSLNSSNGPLYKRKLIALHRSHPLPPHPPHDPPPPPLVASSAPAGLPRLLTISSPLLHSPGCSLTLVVKCLLFPFLLFTFAYLGLIMWILKTFPALDPSRYIGNSSSEPRPRRRVAGIPTLIVRPPVVIPIPTYRPTRRIPDIVLPRTLNLAGRPRARDIKKVPKPV